MVIPCISLGLWSMIIPVLISCWPKLDAAAKVSAMEVSPTHIKCEEKHNSNTATVCANAYAACIAAFVASTWSLESLGEKKGSQLALRELLILLRLL